jgi:hypothetical protein
MTAEALSRHGAFAESATWAGVDAQLLDFSKGGSDHVSNS